MNDRTFFLSLIRNTTIAVTIVSLAGCDRSPSAEKKILGTWQATIEEERTTLVFTPNNQLFLIEGDSPAVAGEYQLNTKTKPMQLDIIGGQEKDLAIFEFADNNKLRIEVAQTEAGNARPNSFSSQPMVFEKVSDSTSLPANTRVENAPSPGNTHWKIHGF